MGQPKILVECINCRNDAPLRELLDRNGYHGCFTWLDYQSLEIGFLPEDTTKLIVAIEELGLTATYQEGE